MADRIDDSSAATLNLRSLERIQRFLQYAAVLVLLVFVALIVVSYFKLRGIRQEISDQQLVIDQQKKDIKQNEAELAEQTKKLAEARKAIFSIIQGPSRDASASDPAEGARTKEAVEDSLPKVNDARQLPARVYMQVARPDQRRRAAVIVRALQDAGYFVPGIETVGDKAPASSQLRYCDGADFLEEDLQAITKALERISIPVTRLRVARCGNVRPRHYEIWLRESY